MWKVILLLIFPFALGTVNTPNENKQIKSVKDDMKNTFGEKSSTRPRSNSESGICSSANASKRPIFIPTFDTEKIFPHKGCSQTDFANGNSLKDMYFKLYDPTTSKEYVEVFCLFQPEEYFDSNGKSSKIHQKKWVNFFSLVSTITLLPEAEKQFSNEIDNEKNWVLDFFSKRFSFFAQFDTKIVAESRLQNSNITKNSQVSTPNMKIHSQKAYPVLIQALFKKNSKKVPYLFITFNHMGLLFKEVVGKNPASFYIKDADISLSLFSKTKDSIVETIMTSMTKLFITFFQTLVHRNLIGELRFLVIGSGQFEAFKNLDFNVLENPKLLFQCSSLKKKSKNSHSNINYASKDENINYIFKYVIESANRENVEFFISKAHKISENCALSIANCNFNYVEKDVLELIIERTWGKDSFENIVRNSEYFMKAFSQNYGQKFRYALFLNRNFAYSVNFGNFGNKNLLLTHEPTFYIYEYRRSQMKLASNFFNVNFKHIRTLITNYREKFGNHFGISDYIRLKKTAEEFLKTLEKNNTVIDISSSEKNQEKDHNFHATNGLFINENQQSQLSDDQNIPQNSKQSFNSTYWGFKKEYLFDFIDSNTKYLKTKNITENQSKLLQFEDSNNKLEPFEGFKIDSPSRSDPITDFINIWFEGIYMLSVPEIILYLRQNEELSKMQSFKEFNSLLDAIFVDFDDQNAFNPTSEFFNTFEKNLIPFFDNVSPFYYSAFNGGFSPVINIRFSPLISRIFFALLEAKVGKNFKNDIAFANAVKIEIQKLKDLSNQQNSINFDFRVERLRQVIHLLDGAGSIEVVDFLTQKNLKNSESTFKPMESPISINEQSNALHKGPLIYSEPFYRSTRFNDKTARPFLSFRKNPKTPFFRSFKKLSDSFRRSIKY
jgi:hypothetical protein